MKPINWEEINDKPANFADLPSGGYVLKVVGAEEKTNQSSSWDKVPFDSITITYEVAEGADADFFASNNKPEWTHQHEFKVVSDEVLASLSSKDAWRYVTFEEKFLPAIKASNPNLHGISDVRQLVGCRFGAVIRHRKYTSGTTGEDGECTEIQAFYAAQDIRDGKFTAAKDVDRRKKPSNAQTPAQQAAYSEDIPF